ncbi:head-tail connector protein [Bacillus atrophaeus]|uniref:head-tail connector protein n=1 Tax=Bacillus atrophaeus TaxID=1452 RepID=UPI000D0401CE|nr:head-tail connector protein [Bacillus atrophaeus]MEC0886834.1 head-tail connector protein [Bacillus atrophaeus]MED1122448.1 head-tail connector protein [Bacillus atrophaeus]PRS02440.1 DNA-packaging protein [Bacillus atrophaeus]
MTLEELKLAMRIDHDFDDGLIKQLKDTAENYIMDAVTLSPNREAFFKDNPKFNTAVMFLVGAWYERRVSSTDKALQEIPFGVTNFIQQFRGAYTDGV